MNHFQFRPHQPRFRGEGGVAEGIGGGMGGGGGGAVGSTNPLGTLFSAIVEIETKRRLQKIVLASFAIILTLVAK
jgi:hypothetical protein